MTIGAKTMTKVRTAPRERELLKFEPRFTFLFLHFYFYLNLLIQPILKSITLLVYLMSSLLVKYLNLMLFNKIPTTFYFSNLVSIQYFFAGAGGKCGDGHESVLQQNGCNSLDDNHSFLRVYILLRVFVSVYFISPCVIVSVGR